MNLKYISSFLFIIGAVGALKDEEKTQKSQSPLKWSPCDLPGFDQQSIKVPIECAKLAVPLDYTKANGSGKLDLQLLKVNATKTPVLGSVLFNPGGPGSSGVDDVAKNGHIFDEVLGGHYDLIGFDPRGTGRTIPFACGINWTEAPSKPLKPRDELVHRDLWTVLESEGWGDSKYAAEKCFEAQNITGSFLSTAFVARDMVRIIDALGEDGMLRYWGGSYGTLLGQTFASMYPERVDRMLLDSVVNGPDYMTGYWLPALQDTEKSLDGFFTSCISAGPSLCSLANFSGPTTTPKDLRSALDSALQSLLDDPILAPPELAALMVWNSTPRTTLYYTIKSTIFAMLYQAKLYPSLAATLQPVLSKNFTALLEPIPSTNTTNTTTSLPYNLGSPHAFWGIGCSEASFRAETPDDMRSLVRAQEKVSGMADGFISKTWPCAQWKMKAAERYSGNFKAKTHFPILFVNGQYDPCTPLASAHNASAGFPGSVVLTHGGQGHKFIRHPSICTAKVVRTYFVNGTLPQKGTFCEADVGAFEVASAGGEGARSKNQSLKARGLDEGDKKLLSRMLEFASLDDGGDWGMQKMIF